MNNNILPILFLLTLCPIANADEYSSEERKWEKCNFKELKTEQATQLKEKQDTRALHMHLIKKCGFRAVKQNNGFSFLHPGHCNILFNHAKKFQCESNEYSEYLSFFLLELNPEVFSEQEYQEACKLIKNSTENERKKYSIFRKKACPAKNSNNTFQQTRNSLCSNSAERNRFAG